jgi:protein SCO1
MPAQMRNMPTVTTKNPVIGGALMPRSFALVLIAVLAGPVCAQDKAKPPPSFDPFDYPVGNFSLQERSGKFVSARDLRGTIWVAHFFVPGCNECIKTLPAMKRLQETYRGKANVRFVSIALAYGEPERLKEFAKDVNADDEQWLMLASADNERVHDIVRLSFFNMVMPAKNPEPGAMFDHSTRLVLIDPQGIMVGYVEGTDERSADTLIREIDKLRMQQPIPLVAADLPRFNAMLNASCTVLLLLGWIAIRLRFVALHKMLMLLALAVSMAFLASYLYYHFAVMHMEPTRFRGEGAARYAYFTILISHTILAIAVAPMAIYITVQGLRNALPQHVRIARWTLPIWLYVSVTGVVVYWMLYVAQW